MNKTKVDDMLIEMIEPKIKEIEKKFGSQQVLTQEDINTLLLKSQFNHINHLDIKLDEVTADVASLKSSFKDLEYKLTSDLEKLDNRLTSDFKNLEYKFEKLEVTLTSDFQNLELKIDKKISSLEVNIEKTMNRNFKQSFYVMGFFFILLKSFDFLEKFIK